VRGVPYGLGRIYTASGRMVLSGQQSWERLRRVEWACGQRICASVADEQQTNDGRWVPAEPLPEPRIWRLWRWLRLLPRPENERG